MSRIVKSIREGLAELRRIRERNIAKAKAYEEREKGKREVTCSICSKSCITYDPVRTDGTVDKFAHIVCISMQRAKQEEERAEQEAKRQRIDEIKQALAEYFGKPPV